MHRYALAPLLLLPALACAQSAAEPPQGEIVEREVRWTDAQQREHTALRRLVRDRDGALHYRYDQQSAEAKRYHDDMCERVGGKPSAGTAVIRGEDAVGSLGCDVGRNARGARSAGG